MVDGMYWTNYVLNFLGCKVNIYEFSRYSPKTIAKNEVDYTAQRKT